MENHCIDVFFACGDYPIHVLTAGSIIPDELNDIFQNRTLQEKTEHNEGGKTDVDFTANSEYIQSLIRKNQVFIENSHQTQWGVIDVPSEEQVLSHFRFYASQGFYSCDCSEVKEDGTAVYRLMAWPNQLQPLNYQLPQFTPREFSKGNNEFPLPETFLM